MPEAPNLQKPPMGVVPRKFSDRERYAHLKIAICNYINDNRQVPLEWLSEYNELIDKKKLYETDNVKPTYLLGNFYSSSDEG